MTASPSRHLRVRAQPGAGATQVAHIGAGGPALLCASPTRYVAAFRAPRAKGLDVGVLGRPAHAVPLQSALAGPAPAALTQKPW